MKIKLSTLALLPLLVSLGPAPASSAELVAAQGRGPKLPAGSSAGSSAESPPGAFLLQWDDTLDDELPARPKTCWVQLERVDAVVTGRFLGPVLGQARRATFTGEVAGDERGGLMMLEQREAGYVCSYQLTFDGKAGWRGTWRDSKGRAGTAALDWRAAD